MEIVQIFQLQTLLRKNTRVLELFENLKKLFSLLSGFQLDLKLGIVIRQLLYVLLDQIQVWLETRFHFVFFKLLPVEVFQPRMIDNLFVSFIAEPFLFVYF